MSAHDFRHAADILRQVAMIYEANAEHATGAYEEQGWTDLESGLSQVAAHADAIACVIEERDGMRLPLHKFVPAVPAGRE